MAIHVEIIVGKILFVLSMNYSNVDRKIDLSFPHYFKILIFSFRIAFVNGHRKSIFTRSFLLMENDYHPLFNIEVNIARIYIHIF